MIVTRLTDRMGNQMFQYAIGRQLAEANKTVLKIDISCYQSELYSLANQHDLYSLNKIQYALHCFNIQADIATYEDLKELYLLTKGRYVQEQQFHFDTRILKVPQNNYLCGYWQSEKYFSGVSDILRQEFQFKYLQDSKSKSISDLINSTNSVAIHIRRGDYAPEWNHRHGLCSLDYYYQAIQIIVDKVSEPSFFVFSDEPQYAKENLKLSFPVTIIDHNSGDRSYEDMRLMSQCKHQIIANSTFSWWAAWLNNSPQKIVIAPLKWLNDTSSTDNTRDIIPASWLRI